MKKIFLIIFLLFLFIVNIEAKEIDILSNNVIMYNLNNNKIIYEKNSEEKIKIASLTKMMTAIVAIENIPSLDDKVVITSEMLNGLIEANASVVGFKVGDKVTYKDLLYGTLLSSGADATRALAFTISGSEIEFVKLMNDKAKELGMENTLFANSSGLDANNQYSTVSDISKLLFYALDNETFKTIFQSKEYITTNNIKVISTIKKNMDEFHIEAEYIEGAKTGYTDLAGYCLASIVSHNGISYMLITANAFSELDFPYAIMDSKTIYEYYFENYGYEKIISKGELLATIDNKYSNKKINLLSSEDIYLYTFKNKIVSYEYEGINEISIFTKNGKIGQLSIEVNGEEIILDINKPENIDFNVFIFLYKHIYILVIPFVIAGIYYLNKKRNQVNA